MNLPNSDFYQLSINVVSGARALGTQKLNFQKEKGGRLGARVAAQSALGVEYIILETRGVSRSSDLHLN